MTREELLRELRDCASLADREIAEGRAREAINDYVDEWGPRLPLVQPDDEVIAAFRAALHRTEGEMQDD